jgi:FkbM family methyltransferase
MKVLYDIGANRGLYADAHIANYDRVIMVEANPSLCEFLAVKYQDNPKVTIVNRIVSNDKDVLFYMCPKADTISTADHQWVVDSRFTKDYYWEPVKNLPTISMDRLIEENGEPAFIKIDVEGYEYNVLLSLTKNHCPLSFEWSEEKVREMVDTVEYLFSLGYTKFAVQLEDRYDAIIEDDQWMAKEKILEFFFNHLIPGRKKFWGMIWAS